MGKSIFGGHDQSSLIPALSGDFTFPLGEVDPGGSTESNTQLVTRIAGTFSQATANNNSGTSTSRHILFRKNGALGNQNIAIPDGAADGSFTTDGIHTDAVVSGDLINWQHTFATSSPAYSSIVAIFEATGNHATFVGGRPNNAFANNNLTKFWGVSWPPNDFVLTESDVTAKVRVSGNITNFQVFISANTRTSTIFKTRINGIDGTCLITVGASATGLFESNNLDPIRTGDLINFALVNDGAGGSITPLLSACAIVSSVGSKSNDIFFSDAGNTTNFNANPIYGPIIGASVAGINKTSDDPALKIKHGFSVTAVNFRIYCISNSYTGNVTCNVRKNSANANQSLTIKAGISGWFEDTTNTDLFGPADLVNYQITGGTSGSGNFGMFMMTETDSPPLPPFAPPNYAIGSGRMIAYG